MADAIQMGLRLYYHYVNPPNIGGETVYYIDFDEISQIIPLGVERFDIAGDTRKTVQQTRGIEQPDGSFKDYMYVDTWAISPDKLVLAGVVKIPEAINVPVIGVLQNGIVVNRNYTLIGMLEKIYEWNSQPMRVHSGDKLILFDFIKQQKLSVTLKRRRYPLTVDRPMLVPFELEFVVLEKENDLQQPFTIPQAISILRQQVGF